MRLLRVGMAWWVDPAIKNPSRDLQKCLNLRDASKLAGAAMPHHQRDVELHSWRQSAQAFSTGIHASINMNPPVGHVPIRPRPEV